AYKPPAKPCRSLISRSRTSNCSSGPCNQKASGSATCRESPIQTKQKLYSTPSAAGRVVATEAIPREKGRGAPQIFYAKSLQLPLHQGGKSVTVGKYLPRHSTQDKALLMKSSPSRF